MHLYTALGRVNYIMYIVKSFAFSFLPPHSLTLKMAATMSTGERYSMRRPRAQQEEEEEERRRHQPEVEEEGGSRRRWPGRGTSRPW